MIRVTIREIASACILLLLLTTGPSCQSKTDRNSLKVSGNIETTEVAVSFKIPGRLIQRRFDEGQWVKQGETVASLDDEDLKHQVELARANGDAAKANLRDLLSGSRPQEINEARARVEQAKVDFLNKEKDAERMESLLKSGAISRKMRDDAQTAYKIARESLSQSLERYALIKEGPRKEDIQAAKARAAVAQASLRVAETNLAYAVVKSPISGFVLSKAAEPGEVLAMGKPVLTIGDIDHVWLRTYVDERDIGKVKWGQEASVKTDSYPGKVYRGRVSFISSEAEFTPKSVQTEKERVTLVYRVKIDLNNRSRELKPGMIADCWIYH